MLKVYFKILLLCIPALVVVYFVSNKYSKGFVDYYYSKITAEGKSMVIGTSKASQGIIPDTVIGGTNYEGPMINFAMSSFDSPFSEDYYMAIKKKLDDEVKNGLFIIEIDPTAFCDDKSTNAKSMVLKDIVLFNSNPNYEYLFRNINPFYKLIERDNVVFSSSIQHKNGWLEIVPSNKTTDNDVNAQPKFQFLKNTINNYVLSEEKVEYFNKTIDLLKEHGKVILVVIPSYEKIQNLEKQYFFNLEQKVLEISKMKKVEYFDLSYLNKEYDFHDGNHLTKESAILFSKKLNELIKSLP